MKKRVKARVRGCSTSLRTEATPCRGKTDNQRSPSSEIRRENRNAGDKHQACSESKANSLRKEDLVIPRADAGHEEGEYS